MKSPRSRALIRGMVLAGSLLVPTIASGQERISVTIDFVSQDGVYLTAGSAAGLTVGDTLTLFPDSMSASGDTRLELTSVTRRRSVGSLLMGSLPEVGSVVFIDFEGAQIPITPAPPSTTGSETVSRPTTRASAFVAPRITGYASMSVDLRESEIAWSGDLAGSQTRRFATPVARLSMTASSLPGGLTMRAQTRASHRYDASGRLSPATSVRAYEFSVSRRFDRLPVDVRAGRLHNPYESYSSYLDGLIVRLGQQRGSGIGVAAGYEPRLGNQGIDTDASKVSVFGNLVLTRGALRYSSEVSGHRRMSSPDRLVSSDSETFVGWSQRLRAGRFTVTQRLRFDHDANTGEWSLRRLRLRGRLGLGRVLDVSSGYSRALLSRPAIGLASLAPLREEYWVGLGARGPAGTLSVTAARTRWDNGRAGLSLSGRSTLAVGVAELHLSGQRWDRDGDSTSSISPGVGLVMGGIRSTLAYRLLSRSGSAPSRTHMVDFAAHGWEFGGTRITLGAARHWGAYLRGTRLRGSVSRSF